MLTPANNNDSARNVFSETKRKAFLLWLFGLFGALNLHNFYLGKPFQGIFRLGLYLLVLALGQRSEFRIAAMATGGCLVLWNLADLLAIVRLPGTISRSGSNAAPMPSLAPRVVAGKGLHRVNVAVNLFLKAWLLLMLAVFALSLVSLHSGYKPPKDTKTYDVYINGIWAGISAPERRINFSGFGVVAVPVFALVGLYVLYRILKHPYLVDFEKGGGMRNASRKRFVILCLAVLFGYTGVDSFLLKRAGFGIVKLAAFLFLVVMFCSEPNAGSLVFIGLVLPMLLFAWVWNILKILSGTAPIGHGRDNVWDSGVYLK